MTTLAQRFFANARNQPEKTAIWCDGKEITYQQLAFLISQWSAALLRRGVARGEHIGILLPNSVEFVALMLVAANLGAVLVPISLSLPPKAVEKAFRSADVNHVIAEYEILEALYSDNSTDFRFIKGMWITIEDGSKFPSLTAMLAEPPLEDATFERGQDQDAYILTMTSGSTGDPKPIILTQSSKLNRAAAATRMYDITPSDRTLAATPLYHSLAERLVLIPLLSGGTSILMSRFSAEEWLRIVSDQRVSFTIAVSSQLNQIAALLASGRQSDVGSLRCLVSSSALLDTAVKESLSSNLDRGLTKSRRFHECYGTSEIAIASNLDSCAARTKLKSVGKAAPGVDLKIIGENDEPLPTGQIGEIVCQTPMLFGGYYKRPDLTQAAMWSSYFRTGDLGRLDQDGFLYFLGRKKEIIITGGINVFPSDIESVIAECGMTHESAAFALPDERLGEVVAVALVPKDPGSFRLKPLRLCCATELADFQIPRHWFVIDALPKNAMGKIMKNSLQALYGKCAP